MSLKLLLYLTDNRVELIFLVETLVSHNYLMLFFIFIFFIIADAFLISDVCSVPTD